MDEDEDEQPLNHVFKKPASTRPKEELSEAPEEVDGFVL